MNYLLQLSFYSATNPDVDFEGEPIRARGQKLGTLSSYDSSDKENVSQCTRWRYWLTKTMKYRPYWFTKPVLSGLKVNDQLVAHATRFFYCAPKKSCVIALVRPKSPSSVRLNRYLTLLSNLIVLMYSDWLDTKRKLEIINSKVHKTQSGSK